MNVLVFHNIEKLAQSRESAKDWLFCFERYAKNHNYLYHNITLPITDVLRNFRFDVVIFDSTSLGVVTFRPLTLFYDLKDSLSFLSNSSAVKLAFPQDDYNHSDILDEWLFDLNCDAVFTPLIEHHRRLYPRSSQRSDFFGVLTGYVDDQRVEPLGALAKPFGARSRLIAQRVTLYPVRGGRFSRIKGETAEMVKRAALARELTGVDISTDPLDVLVGDDWFRFLGDAKFCLGAESGVSLWDRTGEIADRTEAFTSSHANTTFEEVEAACFTGLDGAFTFSAVSPRLFEAALMRCCQILVTGKYVAEIKPYEHYIPLHADGSNLDEVFELIKDEQASERRTAATFDALIENRKYRFSRFVEHVVQYLARKVNGRDRSTVADAPFESARRAHRRELLAAISDRERARRFDGNLLHDRVASLFAGQAAEPYSQPDGTPRLIADLAEDLAALLDRNRALHAKSLEMAVRLEEATECGGLPTSQRDMMLRYINLDEKWRRDLAALPFHVKISVAIHWLFGRSRTPRETEEESCEQMK